MNELVQEGGCFTVWKADEVVISFGSCQRILM